MTRSSSSLSRLLSLLNALILLLYPLLVYLLMDRVRASFMALILVLYLARGVLWKVLFRKKAPRLLLFQGGGILLLAILTWFFGSPLLLRSVPALISLFLGATFLHSLFSPPSMVERYARAVKGPLSPEEGVYCRTVTMIWILFMVLNALIVTLINLFLSLEIWLLYTGLLSYIAMGLLFTGEFLVRRWRFREYGPGLHDRLARALIEGLRGAS